MSRMHGADDPNPTPGNNPDEYSEHDCPFCDATVKRLPEHIAGDCEEVADAQ